MRKTMDFMKKEEFPMNRCQSIQSIFKGYAVHNARLRSITGAKTAPNMFLRDVCHHLIEGNNRQHTLAQVHQHNIDGHPVQPSGEKGFAAKRNELAMQLKESFLR